MLFEPDSNPDVIPMTGASPGVLVTGASGFLGREIVHQFLTGGRPVRGLARNWATQRSVAGMQRCVGDITDPASLTSSMEGIDTVIHSAGLAHQFGQSSNQPDAFRRVNVQGTQNVVRAAAAAGVRHIVLVSSVSVYGGGQQPTDETCECRPVEPYGVSKLQAEQVAREIAAASGLRLTILRMATIFGEGDPGNIQRLMRAIDRGRFVWLGTGTNRKSMIYCGDAARACLVAARAGWDAPGESDCKTYNISLPAAPVAQIVAALATGLGRSTPRWYIPAPFARTLGGGISLCTAGRGPFGRIHRTITKWLSDDIYPGQRFERDYGFRPEVSLEEGLGRETAWFRHSRAA